jgi:hypothetical protein
VPTVEELVSGALVDDMGSFAFCRNGASGVRSPGVPGTVFLEPDNSVRT